jgi:hypothetical protein
MRSPRCVQLWHAAPLRATSHELRRGARRRSHCYRAVLSDCPSVCLAEYYWAVCLIIKSLTSGKEPTLARNGKRWRAVSKFPGLRNLHRLNPRPHHSTCTRSSHDQPEAVLPSAAHSPTYCARPRRRCCG